ncbi:hypothetical protein BU16DRAFT_558379 [Lophium mytilinum]|uniref:Anaphase-promoting complex, subunit CDC26 n=1 Tax=Lophium mytilinum TaxID=390894 RepID=A0A6A6R1Q0_9PEZI|nr:hypothetical protein BU16DRAFT_558379 [Lophium mytilinum]
MLRRPATLITLTADDIAKYEQDRQRRQEKDPNDELKPLPQEKGRIARTRDERIMGSRN